MSVYKINISN